MPEEISYKRLWCLCFHKAREQAFEHAAVDNISTSLCVIVLAYPYQSKGFLGPSLFFPITLFAGQKLCAIVVDFGYIPIMAYL